MKIVATFLVSASGLLSGMASAQGVNGYYRQPAASGDHIVFVSEGDLWSVSWDGGLAHRLTSHPGSESSPVISPDGAQVAFTGEYDGVLDLYVMPIAGGQPKRLTWEGERARPVSWTPANEVLYTTTRYSTLPDLQLVAVNPAGRDAADCPAAGVGRRVRFRRHPLFTRIPFQAAPPKRYQGHHPATLEFRCGCSRSPPLTTTFPEPARTDDFQSPFVLSQTAMAP